MNHSLYKKILDFCPFAFIIWQVPEKNPTAESLILAYANEKANLMALKTVTDKFGKTMGELFPTAIVDTVEHNFPACVLRVNATGEFEIIKSLQYVYEGKLFFYDLHLIPLEKNSVLSILNNVTEQTQKDHELLEHIKNVRANMKLRTIEEDN